MAESFTRDRIVFQKGQQKKFLLATKSYLDIKWEHFARTLGVHSRTVCDWKNEKTRMPYEVVIFLSRKTGVSLPEHIEIIDWKQHLQKASRKGGKAKYKRYGSVSGDEKKRVQAWRKWWEKEGKFKKNPILETQAVQKPRKNERLAEFVGIMMGDGGLAKYHATVTLHKDDDSEYVAFVLDLFENLFGVRPKIYEEKRTRAVNLVVHRKDLVLFCNEIGLQTGSKLKQGLRFPSWIKNNERYIKACIRGLVDTDGSVFTHSYKVKGKIYQYKKMAFTSRSSSLCKSVQKTLEENGVRSRITKRGDVRIENTDDVKKYFGIFSSHNPKHLKRYDR